MSDLRLDTTVLTEGARRLDEVSLALAGTDTLTTAAEAAGHGGLAEALRDFTDGSTRRRRLLGEDAATLAELLRTSATTFVSVEDSLAAALVGGQP